MPDTYRPRTREEWRQLLGGGTAADEMLLDAAVAAAVDRDDPFAVHRALRGLRRRTQSGSARAEIDAVLDRSRVFARPLQKAPGLGRLNGIGTGMYGSADYDAEDDTYVKTRWFSVVFVPLIPLDAWLVRDSGRGWQFFAQVPVRAGTQRTGVRIVACIALAIAVYAGVAAYHGGTSRVHVVNALDVPLHVTIGSDELDVEPQGRATCRVAAGSRHVVARAGDRTLEEFDVDVDGGRIGLYNVLGAAQAVGVTVPYSSSKLPSDAAESLERVDEFALHTWVSEPFDVEFEEPPSSVEIPRGQSFATRRVLHARDGGWADTVEALLEVERGDDAAVLAARVACAEREHADAVERALGYVAASGARTAALEVVRAQLRAAPGDAALERIASRLEQPDAEADDGR